MRFSFIIFFSFIVFLTHAQDHVHKLGAAINFPSIPGFLTLKCDFHQHTVFSDGNVWPSIRVMEALMEGLDAISLTEHLEYQPHKDDIPHPDRNRSYEIALKEAKDHQLLIVNGSEITRSMPPGHNNAIFLTNSNSLLVKDPLDAFRQAKTQGAFIFWNHPNWVSQRKDGIATLTDFHKQLIREGLLNGIEVVNEHTYSEEALQIAIDNNLTIMGTSDIHGIVGWEFGNPTDIHRPVTLVFASERSQESLKDALLNHRTVAFFKDLLIGNEKYLLPLLNNMVQVTNASYIPNSTVLKVDFSNNSSCPVILRKKFDLTLHSDGDIITIPAMSQKSIEIKTGNLLDKLNLQFEVMNAIFAPQRHPIISWGIKVADLK